MSRRSPEVIEVPGYQGRAAALNRGALLRVTDVEGCQIGDLFVLAADDPRDFLSPAVTRLETFRLAPQVGDRFFSSRHRHMLTFVRDTSPGCHDMAFAPCDAQFYARYGGGPEHPNCRQNFFEAVQSAGIPCDMHPDPLNLFQNTRPDDSGAYIAGLTLSQPGDYVEFRAEMDVVIVLTACSADIALDGVQPIGGRSTPLRVEIFANGQGAG